MVGHPPCRSICLFLWKKIVPDSVQWLKTSSKNYRCGLYEKHLWPWAEFKRRHCQLRFLFRNNDEKADKKKKWCIPWMESNKVVLKIALEGGEKVWENEQFRMKPKRRLGVLPLLSHFPWAPSSALLSCQSVCVWPWTPPCRKETNNEMNNYVCLVIYISFVSFHIYN